MHYELGDLASGHTAAQYDKLTSNYLAFIKLASIRIRLSPRESTP